MAQTLTAPEPLPDARDQTTQELPPSPGVGAVALEREIELQNDRAERLRFVDLLRIDAVARPDQETENEARAGR